MGPHIFPRSKLMTLDFHPCWRQWTNTFFNSFKRTQISSRFDWKTSLTVCLSAIFDDSEGKMFEVTLPTEIWKNSTQKVTKWRLKCGLCAGDSHLWPTLNNANFQTEFVFAFKRRFLARFLTWKFVVFKFYFHAVQLHVDETLLDVRLQCGTGFKPTFPHSQWLRLVDLSIWHRNIGLSCVIVCVILFRHIRKRIRFSEMRRLFLIEIFLQNFNRTLCVRFCVELQVQFPIGEF